MAWSPSLYCRQHYSGRIDVWMLSAAVYIAYQHGALCMTPAATPTVFVVDDDDLVRAAIHGMLKSVGLRSETFGSAQEFLASKRPDAPSCLVLDVRLPGLSGLDFQRELADAGIRIPIIFITGHGDIPMSVKAMKSGAVEFLTKP